MAIRIKHFDQRANGTPRIATVNLGLVTSASQLPIFVAPLDCRVDFVDLYNRGAISANTSDTLRIHVYREATSGSTDNQLVAFLANTSAGTNAYSANGRIRLTPSGGNSLTTGALIALQFSAVCQGNLSQTLCVVTYTPLIHKSTY